MGTIHLENFLKGHNMTNHIEEMMRTAGCKQQYCGWLDMGDLDTQYEYVRCDTLEEWKEKCCFSRTSYSWDDDNKDWETPELEYPDFTAEKQLEIIKLIGFSDYSISIYEKGRGTISVAVEPNTFKYSYSAHAQDFAQALANLTTELMKANELDKEKVKGILEGC